MKCVLISFNKITSSEGLTFFFEMCGLEKGRLKFLVSASRRDRLPELNLLLGGTSLDLENLCIVRQDPP